MHDSLREEKTTLESGLIIQIIIFINKRKKLVIMKGGRPFTVYYYYIYVNTKTLVNIGCPYRLFGTTNNNYVKIINLNII